MKFYDRINELETLSQIEKQSVETACFTIMVGRRRIGKTSLLLRSFAEKKMLYLFVSRNSEAVLCSQFQQQACETLGLQIYGTINRFADLFEQLLIFSQKEHYTEHIPVEARWTANVCFGGKDMKTLFITASQCLYSLRMNVKGVR